MKKQYGLIGYPVKHSLSPAMHNAWFKALGIDAEYKLFEVNPENLKVFFEGFKDKLSGINVTIPHKEESCKYVDSLGPIAEAVQAVNTVTTKEGKLVGHNTDTPGFMMALKDDLNFEAVSKRAVIFGAGGAARAVAFGLFMDDIKRIVLVDIDKKRAASLAGELKNKGCNAIAVENDKKALRELILDSDLLVNATPCGMKKGDPELISQDLLHKDLVVFDLVYNQKETALIKVAKKQGAKAVNGLNMLLYQGAISFAIWTGRKAPLDIGRDVLLKELKQI